ncbi:hypothetical protein J1G44_06575 [Cellulomonas sp. zg-ZUI199]|uniref:Uncharacterized protein n=1 Tax=Cellulomonas wangleii TaxID=2816956 RepID=A0ABX8D3X7_9CELL|nr:MULTISPECIES: hypothetical protein [Cellulomonas]MBO0898849.1 hypothetical protein [Cellulomonas sp. zg-ZUI22]MBO0923862.1 hypothetical protein [Cellulomonas wangleii]MBO0924144.1 hypothetical protein [Cellulomonas wangleii]QVI62168.1 hypothetical protein KG103_17420 [Cellulomonas wangleii]
MSVPPHPPVPPDPAASPPAAPRRPSLTWPVVLTVVGLLVLVAALAAAVGTAGAFVGAVRSDVLTSDGQPGVAVLAAAPAPGAARVHLTEGERYAVHLVVPSGASREDDRPDLPEDVLLLAPSGEVVAADGSPGVTMTSTAGGLVAVSVGAFTAPQTGTYEMAVPSAGVPDAWVALTPDKEFAPFFASIWGTVLGVFVVLGLGFVGSGAVITGVVWWVVRARARAAVAGG